jgi:rod shape-determining protein MreC
MRAPAARHTARSDLLLFGLCLVVAVVALAIPRSWASGVSGFLRETALRPLVVLQTSAVADRTARFHLADLQRSRDSLAVVAEQSTALRRENDNLRALIGLDPGARTRFVAAEVLHRPAATDSRMLLLSRGSADGVAQFDPVITGDGLVGQIWGVTPHSSTALTWTDPDFAASAVTADGRVRGLLAPTTSGGPDQGVLELHGVALRDSLAMGTVVYTAGDGGVYPRGIVVGRITGSRTDQQGFERVYRVVPFTNPGDLSEVLILLPATPGRLPPVRPVPEVTHP